MHPATHTEGVELIRELQPEYITLEEVPQFMFVRLPAQRIASGCARQLQGPAHGSLEDCKSLLVRPWLWIVPQLLMMGYQVDVRILNSAHYGTPQDRKRVLIFAARCGRMLPKPPAPQYHSTYGGISFMSSDSE